MLSLRPFQIVLLAGSLAIFIGAIAFLALYEPSSDTTVTRITDDISIWGTLDSTVFTETIADVRGASDRFATIKYFQVSEAEFIPRFVDALAEGRGPDLIVLPHDLLVELRSKLFALSYEFYTERTFKDTFVEGAEIFARSDGIYALPFAADPLVMYWNRDIFSSNNIALPPTTWEVLRNDTVPTLTRTGGAFDIVQSGVAFGEYRNVRNATGILSMLMLQSGSDMVIETNDSYNIQFRNGAEDDFVQSANPATAAVAFYTEFANPASSLYSWNRSLPQDRQRFLAGDLALYFGYGSELSEIEDANPNLNFDMAPVPQGAEATTLRNFARFYGLAIPKQAKNVSASYEVAAALTTADRSQYIAETLDLGVVHRQTQAAGSLDQFQSIRNQATLIARGWLQPAPEATERAFETMIEDVTSGRLQISAAVSDAIQRLRLAF